LDRLSDDLAESIADLIAGKAKAAKRTIMAITTSNSMRVKADVAAQKGSRLRQKWFPGNLNGLG
jgi:hypothetical protein